jgi:hypothetical protein
MLRLWESQDRICERKEGSGAKQLMGERYLLILGMPVWSAIPACIIYISVGPTNGQDPDKMNGNLQKIPIGFRG